MKNKVPYLLLGCYLVIFGVFAISPYDRAVWWAENMPIVLLVAAVAWAQIFHAFTPLSYIFMAFLIVLHTIGGHFTFERVPFDYVTELFGFERNHYDRLAHFSVGFYAYPIAEVLLKKRAVRSVLVLILFSVFSIFTVAGGYEIFEWVYSLYAESGAGTAVLGSQGDIWDPQKDILADGLGALFSAGVFWWINRRELLRLKYVT